jgi:hypothetical protein
MDMSESINNETAEYTLYKDFRNAGVTAVDSIRSILEQRLFEIEKRTQNITSLYSEVFSSLNHLIALHENLGATEETDYLKKIFSYATEHQRTVASQHASFNIIHYLIEKIRDKDSFRSVYSANTFSGQINHEPESVVYSEQTHPCKWIGFERSGSFFLIRFDRGEKIPYRVAPFVPDTRNYTNYIEYNGFKYKVIDPFILSLSKPPVDPLQYLFITRNGKTSCYAVDKIVRRYLAPRDFISEKIKLFRITSAFSKGTVKLEGRRYIVINN